jgi:hypothetical protein
MPCRSLCRVYIHLATHILRWSLKRSIVKQRTWTSSAFSTNESACRGNGHGLSVSCGKWPFARGFRPLLSPVAVAWSCVKQQTWTSSAFSTNESAWSGNGHGLSVSCGKWPFAPPVTDGSDLVMSLKFQLWYWVQCKLTYFKPMGEVGEFIEGRWRELNASAQGQGKFCRTNVVCRQADRQAHNQQTLCKEVK